ncbi:MAG: hypothetical protein LWX83_18750, partial [Anaerolineae bacterium]|nr:hypothetical protein [Anaerolineae bacterium]
SIKEWDEKIKAYERESHTASATCAPKGGSNGNAEGAYEHYTIPVRVSTVDGNLKVTCETPSLQF